MLEFNYISENLKFYFKNNFTSVKRNVINNDSCSEDSFWNDALKNLPIEPFNFLKLCFPQLNFPIDDEIQNSQLYKEAVLKGIYNDIDLSQNNLELNNTNNVKISIHKSFAGSVPLLTVLDESDFVKIIQALLYKNRSVYLPSSMGASMINGINNWQKINTLKENWQSTNNSNSWNEEFTKNILPNPNLYKDKLIILSKKEYSKISHKSLGISKEKWLDLSYNIRLEHECTHLYTLTKFGIASNNLHDELVADYIGIVKTIGYFDKDWMLLFMGLENFPEYRKGARLENYIVGIDIDSEDFFVLKKIIKNAIDNIFLFDLEISRNNLNENLEKRIDALCNVSLLDIASEKGSCFLIDEYS